MFLVKSKNVLISTPGIQKRKYIQWEPTWGFFISSLQLSFNLIQDFLQFIKNFLQIFDIVMVKQLWLINKNN